MIFSVVNAKSITLYKIETIPPICVLYVDPSQLKFRFTKWPNESVDFMNFDIFYILILIIKFINNNAKKELKE